MRFIILVCHISSFLIGYIHYVGVLFGLTSVSTYILNAPDGCRQALRNIWFAQLFRIYIRGSLLESANHIIKATLPKTAGGCIIAMCHTPWSLFLAHWCKVNNIALVVTPSKKWRSRTANVNVAGGFLGIKKIKKTPSN